MKNFIKRGVIATLLSVALLIGAHAEESNVRIEEEEHGVGVKTFSLRGLILDTETDEPLPGAIIKILGTTTGTAADLDGHFSLECPVERNLTIRVSYMGYTSEDVAVSMDNGEVVVRLMPSSFNMAEVVVTANRKETRRHVAPVLVNVTGAELFANINAQTLDDALKFNPGMRVENNCLNCGFNQVRINGLDGAYSQIVINSRNVFSSLAGVYALELLPTSMIDRVEVVRGGGSALYGSAAIGGTVNIITKAPEKNTAEISYTTTLVQDNWTTPVHDAGLFASVISDNRLTGVSLFGKMKSRDGLDLVRPGSDIPGGKDGFSDLPELYFASLGTSAFWSASPLAKLTLDYFYTQDRRRGGDLLRRPDHEASISEGAKHRIHTGILRYDQNTTGGKDFFSAFVAGSHTFRDTYYGGAGSTPFLPHELYDKISGGAIHFEDDEMAEDFLSSLAMYGMTKDVTLQTGVQYSHNFDHLLFMPATLTAGAEYLFSDLADRSGYRPEPIRQTSGTASLFAQNEWSNDRFGLLIGGRYDHVDLHDASTYAAASGTSRKQLNIFTPRVTGRFNPTEKLHFRASYAHGFRAPQFFDEDLHVEVAGNEVRARVLDPNLHEERSRSVTLSMDYYFDLGRDFEANLMAEGFYTRLLGKFNPEESEHDEKVWVIRNVGDATVYGVNVELRTAYKNLLALDLGFTLQSNLFDEEQEVGLPGDADETSQKFKSRNFMRTPNSYGYFLASWTPTKHFSWTLSGDYTGRMDVPHEGGEKLPIVHDGKVLDGKFYKTVDESLIVEGVDPFFVLSTKLGYTFEMDGAELELNLGANNIFNAYQKDFDEGPERGAGYIYGPKKPRHIFAGIKLRI